MTPRRQLSKQKNRTHNCTKTRGKSRKASLGEWMAVHCSQLSFQPRHRCDECSEHCYTECSVQFFTKTAEFSSERRVSATRGFRSIVFCHTFLRRVEAEIFLVTWRVLGDSFHRKLQSFVRAESFRNPRRQIHCLCHTFLRRVEAAIFSVM